MATDEDSTPIDKAIVQIKDQWFKHSRPFVTRWPDQSCEFIILFKYLLSIGF